MFSVSYGLRQNGQSAGGRVVKSLSYSSAESASTHAKQDDRKAAIYSCWESQDFQFAKVRLTCLEFTWRLEGSKRLVINWGSSCAPLFLSQSGMSDSKVILDEQSYFCE